MATDSDFKISIATGWYPNSNSPYSFIFVHEFARRLVKNKINTFVVTTSLGTKDNVFSFLDKVPIYRLRIHENSLFTKITIKLGLLSKNLARIKGSARKFGFSEWLGYVSKLFLRVNIVHIHAINTIGILFFLIAKILKRKIVITTHRIDVLPTKNYIYYLLRLFALRLSNYIICVSQATKRLTLNAGANPKRTIVIYNTVDEEIFHHRDKNFARERLGIPKEKKVVLFVGNLIPRKGVIYLIEAIKMLTEKLPNCLLIIVGEGEEKRRLMKQVNKLSITKNVYFAGKVSNTALPLYYNAADVFVLPSLHEGHSMVLLEAIASGLPVIATRVGGNIETVFEGINGFLVRSRDSQDLAIKLYKLLSNSQLLKSFSENSVNIFKKYFSEETQIEKIKNVYSILLKKSIHKLSDNQIITCDVL